MQCLCVSTLCLELRLKKKSQFQKIQEIFLSATSLFKYVCSFVTTRHEKVKNCSHIIFSVLRIFGLVVNGWTRTNILSKFQIISKLPAVKSCSCLLELYGTVFGGSDVPINGAAWSTIRETKVLLFWL